MRASTMMVIRKVKRYNVPLQSQSWLDDRR